MNRPFSSEIEAELLRAAEAHPGQGLVLGSDGIARPVAATKIINGQEFTRIRYTNQGAHPPIETWYPTCNLESLRAVCDVEIVVTDSAEPASSPDWAVLGPKLAEALLAFWKLREKQLLALGYASLAEYEALCPENDEHLALRDAISLLPAA